MTYSSATKDTADILADLIHMTMCYRGEKTPTCKSDRGDGLLMARYLDTMNMRLATKERKD